MLEWINSFIGDTVNPIAAYIFIFLLIVLAIYILVRIARSLLGGTYVAGGKSRHLRLAVMDATPVDSHRRLVLVRRDDVEHLILIGGPTDVVVEQNIKIAAEAQNYQSKAPSLSANTPPEPVGAAAERPTAVAPALQPAPKTHVPPPPMPTPTTPRPVQPVAPVVARPLTPLSTISPLRTAPQPVPPLSPPAPARTMPAPAATAPSTAAAGLAASTISPAPTVVAQTPQSPSKPQSEDDSLLAELSNEIDKATNSEADDISLEDEMEGLLANLDTKEDRIG